MRTSPRRFYLADVWWHLVAIGLLAAASGFPAAAAGGAVPTVVVADCSKLHGMVFNSSVDIVVADCTITSRDVIIVVEPTPRTNDGTGIPPLGSLRFRHVTFNIGRAVRIGPLHRYSRDPLPSPASLRSVIFESCRVRSGVIIVSGIRIDAYPVGNNNASLNFSRGGTMRFEDFEANGTALRFENVHIGPRSFFTLRRVAVRNVRESILLQDSRFEANATFAVDNCTIDNVVAKTTLTFAVAWQNTSIVDGRQFMFRRNVVRVVGAAYKASRRWHPAAVYGLHFANGARIANTSIDFSGNDMDVVHSPGEAIGPARFISFDEGCAIDSAPLLASSAGPNIRTGGEFVLRFAGKAASGAGVFGIRGATIGPPSGHGCSITTEHGTSLGLVSPPTIRIEASQLRVLAVTGLHFDGAAASLSIADSNVTVGSSMRHVRVSGGASVALEHVHFVGSWSPEVGLRLLNVTFFDKKSRLVLSHVVMRCDRPAIHDGVRGLEIAEGSRFAAGAVLSLVHVDIDLLARSGKHERQSTAGVAKVVSVVGGSTLADSTVVIDGGSLRTHTTGHGCEGLYGYVWFMEGATSFLRNVAFDTGTVAPPNLRGRLRVFTNAGTVNLGPHLLSGGWHAYCTGLPSLGVYAPLDTVAWEGSIAIDGARAEGAVVFRGLFQGPPALSSGVVVNTDAPACLQITNSTLLNGLELTGLSVPPGNTTVTIADSRVEAHNGAADAVRIVYSSTASWDHRGLSVNVVRSGVQCRHNDGATGFHIERDDVGSAIAGPVTVRVRLAAAAVYAHGQAYKSSRKWYAGVGRAVVFVNGTDTRWSIAERSNVTAVSERSSVNRAIEVRGAMPFTRVRALVDGPSFISGKFAVIGSSATSAAFDGGNVSARVWLTGPVTWRNLGHATRDVRNTAEGRIVAIDAHAVRFDGASDTMASMGVLDVSNATFLPPPSPDFVSSEGAECVMPPLSATGTRTASLSPAQLPTATTARNLPPQRSSASVLPPPPAAGTATQTSSVSSLEAVLHTDGKTSTASLTLLTHAAVATATMSPSWKVASLQPDARSAPSTEQQTTQRAVASSAIVISVLAGLVSPAAASRVARLGAYGGAAGCLQPEGKDEGAISRLDAPIQLPSGAGGRGLDHVSAIICNTVLSVGLPMLLLVHLVRPRGAAFPDPGKAPPHQAAAHVAVALWAYFAGANVEIASRYVFGTRGAEVTSAALAVFIGIALSCGTVCGAAYLVVRKALAPSGLLALDQAAGRTHQHLVRARDAASEPTAIERLLTIIAVPLLESARDPTAGAHAATSTALRRLAIVEDVAMAVSVPLLTTVRSSNVSVCALTSSAAALLALLHLAYVVVARPFARRLDSFFAVAAALALLVVAVSSAAAIHRPQIADVADTAFTVVAALFFVQAFVALAHMGVRRFQRHTLGENRNGSQVAAPLLDLPSVHHPLTKSPAPSHDSHSSPDDGGAPDHGDCAVVVVSVENPLQKHRQLSA